MTGKKKATHTFADTESLYGPKITCILMVILGSLEGLALFIYAPEEEPFVQSQEEVEAQVMWCF